MLSHCDFSSGKPDPSDQQVDRLDADEGHYDAAEP